MSNIFFIFLYKQRVQYINIKILELLPIQIHPFLKYSIKADLTGTFFFWHLHNFKTADVYKITHMTVSV